MDHAGAVSQYPFVITFGVADDRLPDLRQMIQQADIGGQYGLRLSDHDAKQVHNNLEPFKEVIRSCAFEPLLIELAVIQDPRLTEEIVTTSLSTFFVSDVESFSNDAFRILQSWDHGIQRLQKAYVKPIPIVPNPKTYNHLYFQVTLEPLLKEAIRICLASDQGYRQFLKSGWPESQALPKQLFEEYISLPTPSYKSLENSIVLRKKYPFESVDINNLVPEQSIEALARGFIFKLIHSVLSEHNPDSPLVSDEEIQQASQLSLSILKEGTLLIVPFRRPRLKGTMTTSGLPSGAVDGSALPPGGCLFAIVKDDPSSENASQGWTPSQESLRLTDLSLRLSIKLARAGMDEAYSEIAMKEEKQYVLTVATHHLPTEVDTISWILDTTRSRLGNSSLPEAAIRAEAINNLEDALEISTRLSRIATFLRAVQKIRIYNEPPLKFKDVCTPNDFAVRVEMEANKIFNRIKSVKKNADAVLGKVNLHFTGLQVGPQSVQSVDTDFELLSLALLELLRNAVSHGYYENAQTLSVALQWSEDTSSSDIYLTISNPIDSTNIPKIKEFIKGLRGKIGLFTLEMCASAYGLMPPLFKLDDYNAKFTGAIQVGKGLTKEHKVTIV